MKILYLTKGDHVDYQNDCLLIGLKELFGAAVVDVNKQEHNYVTYDEEKAKKLYGMGFSVTRVLPDLECDRTDITAKIKNKYFDYVIYGSICRFNDYLEEILKYYPPHKVVAIDGEDETSIHSCVNYGIQYFKREFTFNSVQNIKPISFAIPTCKVNFNKNKIKPYAFIDPSNRSTYIYKNETDYYNDYNQAMFAKTKKKAGWDCMRHYEIISQGCIPYFDTLAYCPDTVMVNFPKRACALLHVRVRTTDTFNKHKEVYDTFIDEFEKFLYQYGTTKAMAADFINRL